MGDSVFLIKDTTDEDAYSLIAIVATLDDAIAIITAPEAYRKSFAHEYAGEGYYEHTEFSVAEWPLGKGDEASTTRLKVRWDWKWSDDETEQIWYHDYKKGGGDE